MAWLIACPHHVTGIFGLLFFFFSLFFQPALHGTSEQNNYGKRVVLFFAEKLKRSNFYVAECLNLETNLYHQFTYGLFAGCTLYATSFLPYGRFYNRVGGNVGLLLAYMFLFVYLAFPVFRRPVIIEIVL
jgi:hypothetical protein